MPPTAAKSLAHRTSQFLERAPRSPQVAIMPLTDGSIGQTFKSWRARSRGLMDHSADLSLAADLADIADRIAGARFGAVDLLVDVKPNGSPVCDADREIEAAVVEILRARYPELPIFGEELGPAFGGEPTYWAIDPIDGTASFIAGNTGWGFTACLVENGQPVVGVASSVGLARRWWASIEGGAFMRKLPEGEPVPLRVSGRGVLAEATIGWWDGWRTNAPGRASHLDPAVGTLRARAGSVVATGAAVLGVASGELDAAVMRFPDNGPWHSAFFVLVVQSAGGVATDLAEEGEVLFSNGLLHPRLLAVLAGI